MAEDPGKLFAYLLRLACLGQAKYESELHPCPKGKLGFNYFKYFSSPEALIYTQVYIEREIVQITCLAQKHYAISSVQTRTTENPKY